MAHIGLFIQLDVKTSSLISPPIFYTVTAVFSLAHKLQPAIIFIDEVDSFLGQRKSTDNETSTNMKTEFMALWDGFTTDQNARVMVLAATNRPSELDEAILRRFPQAFEIGMPNHKERAEILKVILRGEKVEDTIDYDDIASLCDGYTGSDLLELCKKAAYFPIRDLLNDEKSGKLTARKQLEQARVPNFIYLFSPFLLQFVLSACIARARGRFKFPGMPFSTGF
ncbi:hypothetical protein RDI58_008131 [Solanum bulbocastanum]|uniref:Uncharacterized protein n=1 Tax=Solanum bulbocastanum TaxID=147425 RepID=A0AAN8U1F8_SOLBU